MDAIIDNMNYITLGLLGALLFFIVLGAFWGMIRGVRRSTLRLVTVVIALTLALLMTPLVAKAFVSMEIPGLGDTMSGYIEEQMMEDKTGADVLAAAPGITKLIENLAIALVSLVLFFGMYFVFKTISWIVYAVLASIFCKKYVARSSAEIRAKSPRIKKKSYRLAGMGVGIVTGFVFFAFFMIPVMGVVQGFDEVASHNTKFGAMTNAERTNIKNKELDGSKLIEIQDDIREINNQLQNSAFGKVTKFTGVQALGQAGMTYLTKVDKDINLRNDLVAVGKVAMDGVAIGIDFQRGEDSNIPDKIAEWTENDYKTLQSVVDRLFSIGLVKSGFEFIGEDKDGNPGLIKVAYDEEWLHGAFKSMSEEEDFIMSGYTAISEYAQASKLRDDLKGAINIVKTLYAKDTGMYNEFETVFKNIDNQEVLGKANEDKAVGKLLAKMGKPEDKNSGIRQITDSIFGLNLMQTIFGGDLDLSALYVEPLAKALDITERKEKLVLFADGYEEEAASKNIAKMFTDLIGGIGDIMYLVDDNEDIIVKFGDKEKFNVDNVASVLHGLTNEGVFTDFVRTILYNKLPYDANNTDKNPMNIMTEKVRELIEREGEEFVVIPWHELLNTMQSAIHLVNVVGDKLDGVNNINDLNLNDALEVVDALMDLVNNVDALIDSGLKDTVTSAISDAGLDLNEVDNMLNTIDDDITEMLKDAGLSDADRERLEKAQEDLRNDGLDNIRKLLGLDK